jgi:hypothetical protein
LNKYTGPDFKQKLLYVNLRVEVAAVSRNIYGVEKTVDTHKILINAIKCYGGVIFCSDGVTYGA